MRRKHLAHASRALDHLIKGGIGLLHAGVVHDGKARAGRELRGLGRRKRVGLEIAHGGHVGPERPGDALSDAAGDAKAGVKLARGLHRRP